jgi:hypothetical protein
MAFISLAGARVLVHAVFHRYDNSQACLVQLLFDVFGKGRQRKATRILELAVAETPSLTSIYVRVLFILGRRARAWAIKIEKGRDQVARLISGPGGTFELPAR